MFIKRRTFPEIFAVEGEMTGNPEFSRRETAGLPTNRSERLRYDSRQMVKLTPRLVCRTLLPASFLVFLASMLVSAVIFYQGKQFDAKAAILSDLQSPDENPHGYRVAGVGTILFAILLAPATVVFYHCLQKEHPKLSLTAAILFALGLTSGVSIGILAPFTHGYSPLHVQLASAAFIGIFAGTWLNLLAARAAPALLISQLAALLVVIFLCYGPVDFNNDRLLTSLAFWEWALCIDCGVALWALAQRLRKCDSQRSALVALVP